MSAGAMTDDQWTVRRILDWTITYLKEHGSESPRLDAEVLLAHARKCQRIQLYTRYEEPLSQHERQVMRDLVRRRAAAEPVAYLVGHREFFSLDFIVRPGVFIPRPDTEILVMAALDRLQGRPSPSLLDLCTGSGCVPIAIGKNHPVVQLTAVEENDIPFRTAAENVAKHALDERFMLLQGDLFKPVPPGAKFDVITSNPPYVTTAEMARLPDDIRKHEPSTALEAGADGLDAIRRIIEDSPAQLKPNGWLLFELSPEQAPASCDLLKARGFQSVGSENDLSGQPRIVVGQWPG